MKSLLAYIVFFSFVAIAGFGFTAMSVHDGNHSNCIASVGQSSVCTHEGVLESIAFHSGFFKRLTNAFSGLDVLALLALLVFAVLFNIFGFVSEGSLDSRVLATRRNHHVSLITGSWARILDWLSLHERVNPIAVS